MTTDLALPSEAMQRFEADAIADTTDRDADEITLEIINDIVSATTADDVLKSNRAISSEDYVGKPFVLLSMRLAKSRFENQALKYYAVMTIVDENGERQVLTSSAAKIVSQAWRLRDMEALPVKVVVAKAENPSEAGYYPMWLERPAAEF